MSLCDISPLNILPYKTRSQKNAQKITVLRAARIGNYIVVRYSNGVLRVTHASKIPGAELVRKVKCESEIEACRLVSQIIEGVVKF